MQRNLITGAVLLALLTSLAASLWPARHATITIDAKQRHQTMAGWEVLTRMWEQDKKNDRYDAGWQPYKARIFDRLVDELGIDRVRIELRSGAENPVDHRRKFIAGAIGYKAAKAHAYEKINDNDDPALVAPEGFQLTALDEQIEQILLPIKERVEANGEKLYINLCYVDFKWTELPGTLEHALEPAEYAELIHYAFEHMRDTYGLVPDALEIILEPDNTRSWGGRQIGEAIAAVVPRLNDSGFFPALIAPSTANMAAAPHYFDEMIEVPGVRELTPTLSYHRYDSFSLGTGRAAALDSIRERAEANGLPTAMLEHVRGDFEELHADLTEGNVSAWQQYAIATTTAAKGDSGGYHYVVDLDAEGDAAIALGRRSHGLAQYFRFVRQGAVRIGAATDDPKASPVAFVNRDGTHVVIVKANRRSRISIENLPAGTYGVRHTMDDEPIQNQPDVQIQAGETLSAEMPGWGVITFYQRKIPST